MTTIFALGIIGLFIYWVRTLKQEVSSLQQQLFSTGATGRVMDGTMLREPASAASRRGPDPSPAGAAEGGGMRRGSKDSEGGIPTWTLG